MRLRKRTALTLLPCVSAWQFGRQERFAGHETLIDTGSLGLPYTGYVAAMGDYNGDQLVDLFFVGENQRELVVFEWDRGVYRWKPAAQSRIRTETGFRIVNVVQGDFDYDGRLDVLLMGQENPDGGGWWGTDDQELQLRVHLQKHDGSYSEAIKIPSSSVAQPMALDATGDMRVDLLGFEPPSTRGGKVSDLRLWKNVFSPTNRTLFDLTNPPIDLSAAPECTFPTPHFNAYIDLNGDCLADLFLMCTGSPPTYQIHTASKSSNSFVLAHSGSLPKGTKSVGFADMDRDGTIDLILTVCERGDECEIAIAYNKQMPLCKKGMEEGTRCRNAEDLCVADDEFSFDFSTVPENDAYTRIPIAALLPGRSLLTASSSFRGHFPTPPSIGDYNVDGYPDLLILTSPGDGTRHASLLESRPCDKTSCTEKEVESGRRAFKVRTDGAEALTKYEDVESVHWIDVDDDGSLDIMIQRTNGGSARKVHFIKNNYFHDAFFLKALVLNGACQGWCEPGESDAARYRPYGVSYSGASYKFTVLDPTGSRKATQVGQLPQSSYVSLGTPYSYFGLGRTNNYVENLFVGSTRRNQTQHWINLEGVIPNSQVVVDPWQSEGKKETDGWTRELYLQPGEWIPFVTIVLGAGIILLGVVVLVLHVNERKEDELERKARLLSLNFQAL